MTHAVRMELFLLPVFHAGLLGGMLDGGETQQPGLADRPAAGLRPGQCQTGCQPLAQRTGIALRLVLSQRAAAGAADLRLQPATAGARQRQAVVQPLLCRPDRPGPDRGGLHGGNSPGRPALGGQGPTRSGSRTGHRSSRRTAPDRGAAGVPYRPADPDQRVRHHRQTDLAGLGDLAQRTAAGRPAPLCAELPGAGNPGRGSRVLRADRQPVRLGPAVPRAASRPRQTQAGHPRRGAAGRAAARPAGGRQPRGPGPDARYSGGAAPEQHPQALWQSSCAQGHRPERPAWRGPLHHRPLRLRQDLADPHHQRSGEHR
ncbi:UNVERIFIED_CONTAM: hypothetical protein NCL1_61164 [Trichonephila clavipes]